MLLFQQSTVEAIVTVRARTLLAVLFGATLIGCGATEYSGPASELPSNIAEVDSDSGGVSVPPTTTLPPSEAKTPVLPEGPISPTIDSVVVYETPDPVEVMSNRINPVDAATAFCYSMREMSLWNINAMLKAEPIDGTDAQVQSEFVNAAAQNGVAASLQEAARRSLQELSEVAPPDSGAEFYQQLVASVSALATNENAGRSEYESLLGEMASWDGAEDFGALVVQRTSDCFCGELGGG